MNFGFFSSLLKIVPANQRAGCGGYLMNPRQEDYYEFQARVDYTVGSRLSVRPCYKPTPPSKNNKITQKH